MKIAFINPEYPSPTGRDHGGIASYTFTTASVLAKAGHEVTLISREGFVVESMPENVRILYFTSKSGNNIAWKILRKFGVKPDWEKGSAFAVAELCRSIYHEHGLDVVEVPEFGGLGSAFVPSDPFAVVVHFHTPLCLVDELNSHHPDVNRKRLYQMESHSVRSAATWRSPSNAMRDQAEKLFGIDKEGIARIRYPFARHDIKIAKRRFAADDRIDFLFAGRLEKRKGAALLVSAIPRLLEIDKRINITIAGETRTGEPQDWRAAIERVLTKDQRMRIWFVGALTRDQLKLLYRQSDIFLMTSIFDNAPNTLLEAMDAGLPILASDAAGVNELVSDGVNGLVFKSGDTDSLVSSARRIVTETGLREKLVEGGFRWLEREHDPDHLSDAAIDLYKKAVILK